MLKNRSRLCVSSIASLRSVWAFPLVLTILLLLLTALKINGSSIGIYHTLFYGNTADHDLIANTPRTIRSDESVVNTQMTIAQKANNFERINKHIGNGQDMSVLVDVPYKGWSEIFRPHNWPFFVLPFDNAFALKWWLMGYLLILSAYFFIISLLPGRKTLAALLSLSLFFSPFVQWWYQYITLGPLYYSLFIGVASIHLLKKQRVLHTTLWATLLMYLIVCFALVIYPPFQIPCALVTGIFMIGYALNQRDKLPGKVLARQVSVVAAVTMLAGLIVLIFAATERPIIKTINNTAYPGRRTVTSGEYSVAHFFSGNLDRQLENDTAALNYQRAGGIANQSEDASFILLVPFLFLPSLYIAYRDFVSRKKIDFSLLATTLAFLILTAWLFVPGLSVIGKVTLLSKVPLNRSLIGFGLLNIITTAILVRRLSESRKQTFSMFISLIYCVLIFAFEIILGIHAEHIFPGFIGTYHALAFSLPVPVIIYCLLRRWFKLAAAGFLAFSVFSSATVNPLYRGTAIISETPLIRAIHSVSASNPGRWASEISQLENFPVAAGASSLSGVYQYPQLELWKPLDKGTTSYIYNRYAHVTINLYRDAEQTLPTTLQFPTADHFGVATEPCSKFLKTAGVRYLLVNVPLRASCVQLIKTVPYPAQTFLIYKIDS